MEKLAELRAFTKAFWAASFSTWTSNICSLSRSTSDVDWRSAAEDGAEVAAITECCGTATHYNPVCRTAFDYVKKSQVKYISTDPFDSQCHLAFLTLNHDHDGGIPSRSRIRWQTSSPLPLVGMFLGNLCVLQLDVVNLKELNEFCLVWMLSWIKSLITFATISVPRLIYCVLSYSMTLTVSISRSRMDKC